MVDDAWRRSFRRHRGALHFSLPAWSRARRGSARRRRIHARPSSSGPLPRRALPRRRRRSRCDRCVLPRRGEGGGRRRGRHRDGVSGAPHRDPRREPHHARLGPDRSDRVRSERRVGAGAALDRARSSRRAEPVLASDGALHARGAGTVGHDPRGRDRGTPRGHGRGGARRGSRRRARQRTGAVESIVSPRPSGRTSARTQTLARLGPLAFVARTPLWRSRGSSRTSRKAFFRSGSAPRSGSRGDRRSRAGEVSRDGAPIALRGRSSRRSRPRRRCRSSRSPGRCRGGSRVGTRDPRNLSAFPSALWTAVRLCAATTTSDFAREAGHPRRGSPFRAEARPRLVATPAWSPRSRPRVAPISPRRALRAAVRAREAGASDDLGEALVLRGIPASPKRANADACRRQVAARRARPRLPRPGGDDEKEGCSPLASYRSPSSSRLRRLPTEAPAARVKEAPSRSTSGPRCSASPEWQHATRGFVGTHEKECARVREVVRAEEKCRGALCEHGRDLGKDWRARCSDCRSRSLATASPRSSASTSIAPKRSLMRAR